MSKEDGAILKQMDFKALRLRMKHLLKSADSHNVAQTKAEIRSIVDELMAVKRPPSTNFKITCRKNLIDDGDELYDDHIFVTLKRDDGKEIDIDTLLPENTQIVFGEFFALDPRYNDKTAITIPPTAMDSILFLPALFHEIGHASLPRPPVKLPTLQKYKILMTLFKNILLSGLKRTDSDWELKYLDDIRTLVYADDAEVGKFVKGERDAWAHGLRQLRKLQKDGFDVFAGYEKNADLRTLVFAALTSHELSRISAKVKRNQPLPQVSKFVRHKRS